MARQVFNIGAPVQLAINRIFWSATPPNTRIDDALTPDGSVPVYFHSLQYLTILGFESVTLQFTTEEDQSIDRVPFVDLSDAWEGNANGVIIEAAGRSWTIRNPAINDTDQSEPYEDESPQTEIWNEIIAAFTGFTDEERATTRLILDDGVAEDTVLTATALSASAVVSAPVLSAPAPSAAVFTATSQSGTAQLDGPVLSIRAPPATSLTASGISATAAITAPELTASGGFGLSDFVTPANHTLEALGLIRAEEVVLSSTQRDLYRVGTGTGTLVDGELGLDRATSVITRIRVDGDNERFLLVRMGGTDNWNAIVGDGLPYEFATFWFQTEEGVVEIPLPDQLNSVGTGFIGLNIPASGRSIVANVGTDDLFLFGLSQGPVATVLTATALEVSGAVSDATLVAEGEDAVVLDAEGLAATASATLRELRVVFPDVVRLAATPLAADAGVQAPVLMRDAPDEAVLMADGQSVNAGVSAPALSATGPSAAVLTATSQSVTAGVSDAALIVEEPSGVSIAIPLSPFPGIGVPVIQIGRLTFSNGAGFTPNIPAGLTRDGRTDLRIGDVLIFALSSSGVTTYNFQISLVSDSGAGGSRDLSNAWETSSESIVFDVDGQEFTFPGPANSQWSPSDSTEVYNVAAPSGSALEERLVDFFVAVSSTTPVTLTLRADAAPEVQDVELAATGLDVNAGVSAPDLMTTGAPGGVELSATDLVASGTVSSPVLTFEGGPTIPSDNLLGAPSEVGGSHLLWDRLSIPIPSALLATSGEAYLTGLRLGRDQDLSIRIDIDSIPGGGTADFRDLIPEWETSVEALTILAGGHSWVIPGPRAPSVRSGLGAPGGDSFEPYDYQLENRFSSSTGPYTDAYFQSYSEYRALSQDEWDNTQIIFGEVPPVVLDATGLVVTASAAISSFAAEVPQFALEAEGPQVTAGVSNAELVATAPEEVVLRAVGPVAEAGVRASLLPSAFLETTPLPVTAEVSAPALSAPGVDDVEFDFTDLSATAGVSAPRVAVGIVDDVEFDFTDLSVTAGVATPGLVVTGVEDTTLAATRLGVSALIVQRPVLTGGMPAFLGPCHTITIGDGVIEGFGGTYNDLLSFSVLFLDRVDVEGIGAFSLVELTVGGFSSQDHDEINIFYSFGDSGFSGALERSAVALTFSAGGMEWTFPGPEHPDSTRRFRAGVTNEYVWTTDGVGDFVQQYRALPSSARLGTTLKFNAGLPIPDEVLTARTLYARTRIATPDFSAIQPSVFTAGGHEVRATISTPQVFASVLNANPLEVSASITDGNLQSGAVARPIDAEASVSAPSLLVEAPQAAALRAGVQGVAGTVVPYPVLETTPAGSVVLNATPLRAEGEVFASFIPRILLRAAAPLEVRTQASSEIRQTFSAVPQYGLNDRLAGSGGAGYDWGFSTAQSGLPIFPELVEDPGISATLWRVAINSDTAWVVLSREGAGEHGNTRREDLLSDWETSPRALTIEANGRTVVIPGPALGRQTTPTAIPSTQPDTDEPYNWHPLGDAADELSDFRRGLFVSGFGSAGPAEITLRAGRDVELLVANPAPVVLEGTPLDATAGVFARVSAPEAGDAELTALGPRARAAVNVSLNILLSQFLNARPLSARFRLTDGELVTSPRDPSLSEGAGAVQFAAWYIRFPDLPYYIWTGEGPLELMGDEYLGAGGIVSIGTLNAELSQPKNQLTIGMTMQVLPQELRQALLTDPGPLRVELGQIWSPDGADWRVIPRVFRGRLSGPRLNDAVYQIDVVSRIADVDRGQPQFWSHEAQLVRWPGDLGFEHMRSLAAGVDIRWPP